MASQLSPATSGLTVRRARQDDELAVARLAQLDSADALRGERLVAERDGRAIAAISLLDGRVIADPFVLSADAVALLRLRYGQTRRLLPPLPRLRMPRRREAPNWRVRYA